MNHDEATGVADAVTESVTAFSAVTADSGGTQQVLRRLLPVPLHALHPSAILNPRAPHRFPPHPPYGLLGNNRREQNIAQARQLLYAPAPKPQPVATDDADPDGEKALPQPCRRGGRMNVIEIFMGYERHKWNALVSVQPPPHPMGTNIEAYQSPIPVMRRCQTMMEDQPRVVRNVRRIADRGTMPPQSRDKADVFGDLRACLKTAMMANLRGHR